MARGRGGRFAGAIPAMTIFGDAAIRSAQQGTDTGETRQDGQRACPPDKFSAFQDRVRASETFAVTREKDHFRERRLRRGTELRARPVGLKWSGLKVMAMEKGEEAVYGIGAEGAIGIEEDPGVRFVRFCCFCIH